MSELAAQQLVVGRRYRLEHDDETFEAAYVGVTDGGREVFEDFWPPARAKRLALTAEALRETRVTGA